ncbi:uncharacterized protein LOC126840799 [Adelges cooleyi]|uniref:uncharacterized protein LOC126840799 n=1 Tax=Adelges cooleyi TaxID=133065 RepID=UPI00217FDDFC|nr:uncharacterized protein LOC126840799 [Adelges cooleyi]
MYKEFVKLFDELRNEGEGYVTRNTLGKIYDVNDKDELDLVLNNFGITFYGENGFRETRVHLDKFKQAAKAGFIHRFPKEEMLVLFFKIIGRGIRKIHITYSDLVSYYGQRVLRSQIDNVMTKFGIESPNGSERRLSLLGFRRAVNTGGIPAWLLCNNCKDNATKMIIIINKLYFK